MSIYLQGLIFGIAYIAPIGIQNLFIVSTALEQPLKRALKVAGIVIVFDISLALACFYGMGRLLQTTAWLEKAVLLVGGILVIYIGIQLLRQTEVTMTPKTQAFSYKMAVVTAFSVAWLNPQALIDGSVLLGAFRVTLADEVAHLFMAGVITASIAWFLSLTGLISHFKHVLKGQVLLWINRICGGIIILYGLKLLIDFIQKI